MQKVRRFFIESNGSSAVATLTTWRACHFPKPPLVVTASTGSVIGFWKHLAASSLYLGFDGGRKKSFLIS